MFCGAPFRKASFFVCVRALLTPTPLLCVFFARSSSPGLYNRAVEHAPIGACDFLPPEALRFRLEELLSSRRFMHGALSAGWLRERRPLLYYNLVWYCARLGLPVPLLREDLAVRPRGSGVERVVLEDVVAEWTSAEAATKLTRRCQELARDSVEETSRTCRIRTIGRYLFGAGGALGLHGV